MPYNRCKEKRIPTGERRQNKPTTTVTYASTRSFAPYKRISINDNRIGFELFESVNLIACLFAFWLKAQQELLKLKQLRELLQERCDG